LAQLNNKAGEAHSAFCQSLQKLEWNTLCGDVRGKHQIPKPLHSFFIRKIL
jgi:hypothetical protein